MDGMGEHAFCLAEERAETRPVGRKARTLFSLMSGTRYRQRRGYVDVCRQTLDALDRWLVMRCGLQIGLAGGQYDDSAGQMQRQAHAYDPLIR